MNENDKQTYICYTVLRLVHSVHLFSRKNKELQRGNQSIMIDPINDSNHLYKKVSVLFMLFKQK